MKMFTFMLAILLLGVAQVTSHVKEEVDPRLESVGVKQELVTNSPPINDCTAGSPCERAGGDCHYVRSAFDQKFVVGPECDYLEEGMCNKRECLCCIDCKKNAKESDCHLNGGECVMDCDCGEKPIDYPSLYECPGSGCTCCRPCDNAPECKPGHCFHNITAFTGPGYIIRKDIKCPQDECTCVQKCNDPDCNFVGGQCVPTKEKCELNGGKIIFEECACDSCFCCVFTNIEASN